MQFTTYNWLKIQLPLLIQSSSLSGRFLSFLKIISIFVQQLIGKHDIAFENELLYDCIICLKFPEDRTTHLCVVKNLIQ